MRNFADKLQKPSANIKARLMRSVTLLQISKLETRYMLILSSSAHPVHLGNSLKSSSAHTRLSPSQERIHLPSDYLTLCAQFIPSSTYCNSSLLTRTRSRIA